MIRNFLYGGYLKLTFYLDGDNSYCLYDDTPMETNYPQSTYEIWISQNSDNLTELGEFTKKVIKKHTMT